TEESSRLIDVENGAPGWSWFVGVAGNDGPLAGQLTFATDSLPLRSVIVRGTLGSERASEVASPWLDVAILAKVGADLFLFGHRRGIVPRRRLCGLVLSRQLLDLKWIPFGLSGTLESERNQSRGTHYYTGRVRSLICPALSLRTS